MTSRETRRYKQRGISISFGDIMLPLVGIVAVGLLVVAGKLFFLNGVRSERSSTSVARRRPSVESQEVRTVVPSNDPRVASIPSSERMGSSVPSASLTAVSSDGVFDGKLPGLRRTSLAIDVLAIPYGVDVSDNGGTKGKTSATANPKSETKRVEVVVSPLRKTASPPPLGAPGIRLELPRLKKFKKPHRVRCRRSAKLPLQLRLSRPPRPRLRCGRCKSGRSRPRNPRQMSP